MPFPFNRLAAGASLLVAASAAAASFDFAGWNFNTTDNDGATGTLSPSLGTGTLTGLGGTVLQFGGATGSSEGVFTDNSSLWVVAPAGSQAGDLVGVEFAVSSSGYTAIEAAFDLHLQAAPVAAVRFEYSFDGGGNWTEYGNFSASGSTWGVWVPGTWSNRNLVDLRAEAAADHNPDLRFRILTTLAGTVGADEKLFELDQVVVASDLGAVPEPAETATVMGLGLGVAALIARRRLGRQ